jgi:hypothetical protein
MFGYPAREIDKNSILLNSKPIYNEEKEYHFIAWYMFTDHTDNSTGNHYQGNLEAEL